MTTALVAEPLPTRARPLRLRVHSVLRWLHIYSSMVSLLAVLFFAATGVTLNHPDWLATESMVEKSGAMPAAWKGSTGIDWLLVSEHLRTVDGVRGTVADRRDDGPQATITFKAPGYAADAFIDSADGKYRLTVSYQGALGVLNDLHRGRDAGKRWAGFIDAIGYFLIFLSLTGLGLLWYLKKVRTKAFLTMIGGSVAVLLLAAASM